MDKTELNRLVGQYGVGSKLVVEARNRASGMWLVRRALDDLEANNGEPTAGVNNSFLQAEVMLGQNDDPRVAGKM